MTHRLPHPADRPVRILFVFAWLVVGGEETEVRLLAQSLVKARYRIDVIVRGASEFDGSWPTISVWHGDNDQTVDSSNADSIVRQWHKVHGVEGAPSRVEEVAGFPRRVWIDATGREVIEEFIIGGMGHGTPISASGKNGLGEEGKYMLEVGISSTRHIANFWGLCGK